MQWPHPSAALVIPSEEERWKGRVEGREHVLIDDRVLFTSKSARIVSALLRGPEGANVRKLSVLDREVSVEAAEHLAEAIRESSTIEEVSLYRNSGVGDDVVKALAGALAVNRSVRALRVCNNAVSDEGAVALVRALEAGSTVELLNLSRNRVGAAGARALAGAPPVLRSLVIEYNPIGSEGALAFAALLAGGRCSLLGLALNNTGAEDEAFRALTEAAGRSTRLVGAAPFLTFARKVCERNRALWELGRQQRAALEAAPDGLVPWLVPDLVRIVAAYAGDRPPSDGDDQPAPWSVASLDFYG